MTADNAAQTISDYVVMMLEVGDLDIACDYSGDTMCNDGPAEWVMFRNCPHCHVGGQRLVCTSCKEARLTSDAGVYCNPGCGEVTAPARRFYVRVEAL